MEVPVTKGPWNESFPELSFPGKASSRERMVRGTKVSRNEWSRERMFLGTKSFGNKTSPQGLFVLGNEMSWARKVPVPFVTPRLCYYIS